MTGNKYQRKLREQTPEEKVKYGDLGSDQSMYILKVAEEYLEQLEQMGLWFSDAIPCYNGGVYVYKPVWTEGNNIPDYEPPGLVTFKEFDDDEQDWREQPDSDAARVVFFQSKGHGLWVVLGQDCTGGMGTADFINIFDTPEEALADIKDFFFGDPTRMNAKAAYDKEQRRMADWAWTEKRSPQNSWE